MKNLIYFALFITLGFSAAGHIPYTESIPKGWKTLDNEMVLGELMRYDDNKVYFLGEDFEVSSCELNEFSDDTKSEIIMHFGGSPSIYTQGTGADSNSSLAWMVIAVTSILSALVLVLYISRKNLINFQ